MLMFIFLAATGWATSPECSKNLASFVVRAEFATDVREQMQEWRSEADRLNLQTTSVLRAPERYGRRLRGEWQCHAGSPLRARLGRDIYFGTER